VTDDWDPASEAVQHNQIAAYDAVRNRCPVPHSEAWGWSLLRHQDVVAALTDHATFSNRVSQHVAHPQRDGSARTRGVPRGGEPVASVIRGSQPSSRTCDA
jgi:cytochrome P450